MTDETIKEMTERTVKAYMARLAEAEAEEREVPADKPTTFEVHKETTPRVPLSTDKYYALMCKAAAAYQDEKDAEDK